MGPAKLTGCLYSFSAPCSDKSPTTLNIPAEVRASRAEAARPLAANDSNLRIKSKMGNFPRRPQKNVRPKINERISGYLPKYVTSLN